MIVLDTNVISELFKKEPNENLLAWFDRQADFDLCITSITVGELIYGLSLLNEGRRRTELTYAIDQTLELDFADKILSFDLIAARVFGQLAAKLKNTGKIVGGNDLMIAAICKSHDALLATRNVKDFQNCGIEIENPFMQ